MEATKLAPNTPTCIQTVSGIYVDLLNPTVDMIELLDIVAAAKRIRRFTGHSNVTLAEHSCRVHDIVRYHYTEKDPATLRAALLHDAHEVYVGDASSPLKIAMRHISSGDGKLPTSDYDIVEARIARVVAERFDFPYPHPSIIKRADLIALAIEADLTWGPGTAKSWGMDTPPEGFSDYLNDIRTRLERTHQ